VAVSTVIQAPPGLRPAPPLAAALAATPPSLLPQAQQRREVDHRRASPGNAVADAVETLSLEESAPPAAESARSRQTATATDASTAAEVEYRLHADAQRLPGQVTSPLEVGPVPVRPAPSASLPTGPVARQNRITIGRIDVQVNNHPPALPLPSSAPPPMAHASPLYNLETRFLNRFPMRP
jgi:hypothetical protein